MVQTNQAKQQPQQDPQDLAAKNRVFKAGDKVEITGNGHRFKGRTGVFHRHAGTGISQLIGSCTVLLDKLNGETRAKQVDAKVHELKLIQQVTEEPASDHSDTMATTGGAILIPMSDIIADPNQPRKTFNPEEIKELAASMTEHGLLQSIKVRPQADEPEKYMIVFGEKRHRAAELNGWEVISAIVRPMSDDEALELQVIENLHRSDIHPLQEAQAFNTLHKRLTLEQIADRIGKGRKYVIVRLRLNKLIPVFQDIYQANKMTFEDAKLLSKATEETQEAVYAERTKLSKWTDDNWTIGNYKYLVQKADQNLDKATFDIHDDLLHPEMGACSKCTHNSSVNQLFGDEEGRICNFATCFGIKTERLIQQRLEAAAKEPGILAIGSMYDSNAIERIAAAKNIGLNVIEDKRWTEIEVIAKPAFEVFKANYEDLNDIVEEEEIKKAFDGELNEWEEEQAQYEKALAEGRIKKAIVVTGGEAGTYKSIILSDQAEEQLTNDTSAKIEKLIKQEDNAKLEDAREVYLKASELIKTDESFLTNTKSLTKQETVALVVMIIGSANSNAKLWLEKQLGLTNPSRIDLFDAMLADLKAETMNEFLRKSLAEKLITQYDTNPSLSIAPRAILRIAESYLPKQVQEIQAAQNAITEKRSWDAQERITQLKMAAITGTIQPAEVEPLPIRIDTTMMAIKVCPKDSNAGWKKLEGKFTTVDAMVKRYDELLATGQYFQEPRLQ